MKELYNAPELEIVTFVPMEQLAAGYLDGYARAIGGRGTSEEGASGDIDITIPGNENGEGNP